MHLAQSIAANEEAQLGMSLRQLRAEEMVYEYCSWRYWGFRLRFTVFWSENIVDLATGSRSSKRYYRMYHQVASFGCQIHRGYPTTHHMVQPGEESKEAGLRVNACALTILSDRPTSGITFDFNLSFVVVLLVAASGGFSIALACAKDIRDIEFDSRFCIPMYGIDREFSL